MHFFTIHFQTCLNQTVGGERQLALLFQIAEHNRLAVRIVQQIVLVAFGNTAKRLDETSVELNDLHQSRP